MIWDFIKSYVFRPRSLLPLIPSIINLCGPHAFVSLCQVHLLRLATIFSSSTDFGWPKHSSARQSNVTVHCCQKTHSSSISIAIMFSSKLHYSVWFFFYWIFYSANLIKFSTVILSWPRRIAIKCPDVSHSIRFSIIRPIVGGTKTIIKLQNPISYQENRFNNNLISRGWLPVIIPSFSPLVIPIQLNSHQWQQRRRRKLGLDFERVPGDSINTQTFRIFGTVPLRISSQAAGCAAIVPISLMMSNGSTGAIKPRRPYGNLAVLFIDDMMLMIVLAVLYLARPL